MLKYSQEIIELEKLVKGNKEKTINQSVSLVMNQTCRI